jgi:predicted acetyltransferase
MEIRRVAIEDQREYHRLGIEAFGKAPPGAPAWEPSAELPPGRNAWCAIDDAGLMTARMAVEEYESWWHGARLRTAGVSHVSIAPESRGAGALEPLLAAALRAAAEGGQVISTLYPTANGIYRGFGYELVSSLDTVEVPVAELARVRPPAHTRTRRATPADADAVKAVYDRWAAAQNGPLTRTGPRFGATDEELVGAFTGITLALDPDERVVGFASWDRGTGYDPPVAALRVRDLIAITLDGYRALWTMLGSWGSVIGTIRLRTSGADPARLVLPTSTWKVVRRHPYMLRISDPAGALAGANLGVPGVAASIAFAVAGDRIGSADGSYRLTIGEGPAICERAPAGGDVATFTPQGLAMAFAGVQSCANLRLTDHLAGPADDDALWDALLGGRPAHIRDYF